MRKILATIFLLVPILLFAQLSNYNASFSFGGGVTQYFGDLSHRFVNLKLSSYSVNAGFQYKPTKGIGIELEYKYLNLIGDDRADYFILNKGKSNPNFNRSLNFKSSIHETNLKFYFYLNNGKILSKYAVVSPYFFVGIGGGIFNSRSNLLDASGNQYNYWSDGTIRDLAETDPLSASAQIIEKDKSYETNLRSLETETKYSNFKWQVPFGLGLNFKLTKNIYLSLQTEWVYNFTDYIDDVGNKTKKSSYPSTFIAYAADPANVITSTRGNNNKWKDSYLNTSMKFNFYFGNKERKIAKNLSSYIVVPPRGFSIKVPIDTIVKKIDTVEPRVKDTVIIIYKLIEYANDKSNKIIDSLPKLPKNNIVRIDTILKYDTIFENKKKDTLKLKITNLKSDSIIVKKRDSLMVVKKDTIKKVIIKKINDSIVFKKASIIEQDKTESILLTNSDIEDVIDYSDSIEIVDVDSIINNIKIFNDTLPKYNKNILLKPKQKTTVVKDSIKINKVETPSKTVKVDTTVKVVIYKDSLPINTLQQNKVDTVKVNITNAKKPISITSQTTAIVKTKKDTIVVVKTNNSKDSIVLNNHVLLKNIYNSMSNNNELYDSINQKLSKIISKNENTRLTQKVATKNDTVYKYITVENLSKEQIKEVDAFKAENDKLKISLANQKKYNDSITIANQNLEQLNENAALENLVDKKINEKLNTASAAPAPATNLLPANLQEIISQEIIRNKNAQEPLNYNNNSQSSQEIELLKREIDILKLEMQNTNSNVAEPVKININEDELTALKLEIETLKQNSITKDTVVLTSIDTVKNKEIVLLKNEIEKLKKQNKVKDTVVIAPKIYTKNEEINNLKNDLVGFKNEIQQLKEKAIEKQIAVTKTVETPKDSLLLQVFFATSKTEFDDAYIADLEKIYFTLLFQTDVKLLLTGFADRDGDKNTNMKLSAERAQSVKNYFVVTKKINYNRILMNYVGSNQTKITDNKDYNRRVDVYLLK